MAANIQYFGDKLDFISRRGNEARIFSNNQYLDALTSHVEKVAVATCGICYVLHHLTDMCPEFQDDLSAPINTCGDFSPLSQVWCDPYSNGHDQGWWDNFNFNYAIEPMDFQQ